MRATANIDASILDEALESFKKAIGEENVIIDDKGLVNYRDKHAPNFGEQGEFFPSAALRPENVEEVQEIVRIANKYTIPLNYFSRGRNFGYGGPNAVENLDVTLDLSRMTKILEINEKFGYVVVEPGVTLDMLWNEMKVRGLDKSLWIDGASNPYGSILGNAMDRGVGYGLRGVRAEEIQGMEIVLPDASVMRTGMWAMTKAKTSHQYKYGFGPSYDTIFQQSNFGIVVKAGINLIRQPDCFRAAEVYTKGFEDIGNFIDVLRELQLTDVIDMSASGAFNFGGPRENGKGPWGGWFPPEKGMKPTWRVRLGYYGDERVVDARWDQTIKAFEDKMPGRCIFEERKYHKPYDYTDWPSESLLAAGVPSDIEVDVWDHYGTFTSVCVPYDGEEVLKLIGLLSNLYAKYDLPYFGSTFHIHTKRTLIFLINVPMGGENFPAPRPDFTNDIAVKLTWDIINLCEENGYGKYRSALDYHDHAAKSYDFNNNRLLRFSESIKDTLDPNGILAPGKYGIWPKRIRDNK